jgi:hypothetical protein
MSSYDDRCREAAQARTMYNVLQKYTGLIVEKYDPDEGFSHWRWRIEHGFFTVSILENWAIMKEIN